MDPIMCFIFVVSVLLLIVYRIRKHYSVWKDMGAPYEESSVFYGNLKGVGKTDSVISRLQKIYNKHKEKSPFVGIFFFFKPVALVMDVQLAKDIMIKDFDYFINRGMMYYNEKDDPLSAHMFNIYGAKWRLLRTKLSPAFTSGKMKMIFPCILGISKRLEEKFNRMIGVDAEMDIKQIMARYTTDVIGTAVFGIECNSLNEEDNKFHKMGIQTFDKTRHSFPMLIFFDSIREYAVKFGIKRLHDEVHDFFSSVIRSTVDYRISNNVKRNDFMELLLDLYRNDGDNKLTFNELAAQAFVFFAAGFETSSSLLQFCLFELSRHPEIQEKTRRHIEEVIAQHNGELTYEAMLDMKYLDAILYETLRMYPPVAILSREAARDYKIRDSPYTLKKGTIAIISAYAIQRDVRFYSNPDQFNPENCSEENIRKRPLCSNLWFGEGPRNCIGARFGMMQSRIGLITALRNYQFGLSPKTEIPLKISPTNFITTIVGGVWLKVKRLSRND